MKNTAATLLMLVLGLVTACTPAAPTPTPTPVPTATPVEVTATKPEHLAGIWLSGLGDVTSYFRFQADGTLHVAQSLEGLDDADTRLEGRFWFEDGLYHEENRLCAGTYVYEAFLGIQEGQAVRARMREVDVPGMECIDRRLRRLWSLVRVD